MLLLHILLLGVKMNSVKFSYIKSLRIKNKRQLKSVCPVIDTECLSQDIILSFSLVLQNI